MIALFGVSTDRNKIGYKMFHDLLAHGFNVRGINPKNGEILGYHIYKSISELNIKPDIAVIVVKPEITERLIDEIYKAGIKNIWMQPGSESEIAIKKAQDYGIKVVYGKCFMSEKGIW